MYCSRCGKEIPDTANFCRYCGATVSTQQAAQEPKNTNTQRTVQSEPSNRSGKGWLVLVIAVVVVVIGLMFAGVHLLTGHSDEEASEQSEIETADNEEYAVEGLEAETANNACGDNLTWTLESGTLTISGTGAMADYSEWGFDPWCDYRDGIIEVIIESGATSIGLHAFDSCNNLVSITIPNSVTSIGYGAFAWCSNLTSITIPDGVTSIGERVFKDCSSLTSITIPVSVTSIGDDAFLECYNLTDVYYAGSEDDWANIFIGDDNDDLTNATIHYNSN